MRRGWEGQKSLKVTSLDELTELYNIKENQTQECEIVGYAGKRWCKKDLRISDGVVKHALF